MTPQERADAAADAMFETFRSASRDALAAAAVVMRNRDAVIRAAREVVAAEWAAMKKEGAL